MRLSGEILTAVIAAPAENLRRNSPLWTSHKHTSPFWSPESADRPSLENANARTGPSLLPNFLGSGDAPKVRSSMFPLLSPARIPLPSGAYIRQLMSREVGKPGTPMPELG